MVTFCPTASLYDTFIHYNVMILRRVHTHKLTLGLFLWCLSSLQGQIDYMKLCVNMVYLCTNVRLVSLKKAVTAAQTSRHQFSQITRYLHFTTVK